MKLGALYYVRWLDARGVDAEWTDVPAAVDLCHVESVGWLVAKDRTGIALVPHSVTVEPGVVDVCGTMHILRKAIVVAHELTVPEG
jgi:hypothetical protein